MPKKVLLCIGLTAFSGILFFISSLKVVKEIILFDNLSLSLLLGWSAVALDLGNLYFLFFKVYLSINEDSPLKNKKLFVQFLLFGYIMCGMGWINLLTREHHKMWVVWMVVITALILFVNCFNLYDRIYIPLKKSQT